MVKHLSELLENKAHFNKKTDFTRNTTFGFMTMFCMLTNLPHKTLNLEVDEGLSVINKLRDLPEEGTKSGFLKSRKKIKPELFTALNDRLISNYYSQSNLKRWHGFLLRAIDGSILNLIDTKSNRDCFGEGGNAQKTKAQARCVLSYDPLNGLIDKYYIGHMKKGENYPVKQWVADYKSDELCIYDRLFPSMMLMYSHAYKNSSFVMRCKLTFNKHVEDFVASGAKELVKDWTLSSRNIKELKKHEISVVKGTQMKVRLIRIELSSGETEVLITNLTDKASYPYEVFGPLYFLRWGVETIFGYLKNTLLIESWTGHNSLSVLQDFGATILRANVQKLIENDAQECVEEINEHRQLTYKVNRTAAVGSVKKLWPALLLKKKKKRIYLDLIRKCARHLEPERKGRSFERMPKKWRNKRGKYVSVKNYKIPL